MDFGGMRDFSALNKLVTHELLDFLPYPFLVSEKRSGVWQTIYLNSKFVEEIGYKMTDIPTLVDWFHIAYPSETYRSEVYQQWKTLSQKAREERKDSVVFRAIIKTKTHGEMWYEIKASLSDTFELVAFVNINEEILREKRMTTLNENQRRILSILSHDLRSPLTNIYSLLEASRRSHLTAREQSDAMEMLGTKTFHVIEFLNTTLQWTWANFDNVSASLKITRISEVINDICQLYASVCESKDIGVEFICDDDCEIVCDREIISIAFRNVLSNAVKFSRPSSLIMISLVRSRDGTVISVKDQGIGISQERITDILGGGDYRSECGTSNEKGLGLGLKLTRELLQRTGARLEIDSVLGSATTVHIFIPNYQS